MYTKEELADLLKPQNYIGQSASIALELANKARMEASNILS